MHVGGGRPHHVIAAVDVQRFPRDAAGHVAEQEHPRLPDFVAVMFRRIGDIDVYSLSI